MSGPANNVISRLPYTAEAIFASIVEAGHAYNSIRTFHKGGFKKGYSHDVDSVVIEAGENNFSFELVLNRDGIYDLLPEGLFHQTKGSTRVNSVKEAVDEHRQFKEEEKQARKFFTPVEQMLFQYKAAAEIAERDILYDIQNGKLNRSFYEFWNISYDLPEINAGRLLQLMPYCDAIKGDVEATESALAYVLNETTTLEVIEDFDECFIKSKAMNEQRLGIDSVTADYSMELSVYWKCTVHDLSGANLSSYCAEAPLRKLIDRFVEIFVPLDVDIIFDFIPATDPLSETYENILGVGAHL